MFSQEVSKALSYDTFTELPYGFWLPCFFHFPRPVTLNPLIQRQRLIVRIAAKTVDHIAGDVSSVSFHIRGNRFPDPPLELFQQTLVTGILDMPVQHIGFGISLFIQAVLPVIKKNRIMAQNHLPLMVRKLFIGPDPLKAARVQLLVPEEPVMISLYQIKLSL